MKNDSILSKVIAITFPLIVMALTIILFSPSLLSIGSGTILFYTFASFPLIFIVQGITCAFIGKKSLITLGLSAIVLVITVFLFGKYVGYPVFNQYLLISISFEIIGYAITFGIRKFAIKGKYNNA